MSEICSRKLLMFVIAACVCTVQAQPVLVRPDRLREGDGKTRNITLEASVAPGARLNVAVSYSSDPSASDSTFIPTFSVQDNSSEDRNPQDGKIRLVLPKPFYKTGVYIIQVDEPRSLFRLVHEPNNTSYFGQFVDWLVGAAGGGQRSSERISAVERIEEITKNKDQDKIAIWTAPMPAAGQEIEQQSLKLKIPSALMPSWSRNGKHLVCSAWRNGKWSIVTYKIDRAGTATQFWQWNSPVPGVSDFSPTWSPNGDGVVFVRLDQDRKSNIWILELDRKRRPKKEIKLTSIGNVLAVLGWEKDIGILFETRTAIEGHNSFRQTWALKPTVPKVDITPLNDAYNLVRGSAPLRRTIIYAQENDGPPLSVLYEMNSSGKRQPLLIQESCTNRWPTVSPDEKWLAFESDCPR